MVEHVVLNEESESTKDRKEEVTSSEQMIVVPVNTCVTCLVVKSVRL